MRGKDLTEVEINRKVTVVEIHGGHRMRRRLETLGIRTGCEIQKVSSHILRGPVIVRIGNTRAAIGYGMAKKIIVE